MSTDTTIGDRPGAAGLAAAAAAARAASCRRRIAALHSGHRVEPQDARAAREALLVARERARLAELRRIGRQNELGRLRARSAQFVASIETLNAVRPTSGLALRSRLDASGHSVEALFTAYLTIGGNCELFEVDAYVHGVGGLPTAERAILAHALWELQEFS